MIDEIRFFLFAAALSLLISAALAFIEKRQSVEKPVSVMLLIAAILMLTVYCLG